VASEDYSDAGDLARRVQRRLEELASEALSPWIKLGDFVFRADEVVDAGNTITIRARVSEEIAHQLEALRDRRYGRERLRFVSPIPEALLDSPSGAGTGFGDLKREPETPRRRSANSRVTAR
jgi:hypothetical protein